MKDKITKLKELIVDKLTTLIENKELTVDEYGEVVSILSSLSYDPSSILSQINSGGFNGGFVKPEMPEVKE